MIAPSRIIHDPPCLLADVRQALSIRPTFADYPERLAALLGADDHDVVIVLEVLQVEDEVLA